MTTSSSAVSTGGKCRTIVLLYVFLTGLLTILVGIVLNQLGLLPSLLSAIATGISGSITLIAGSWVLVERFFLPQKPNATPPPRLSGRQVTGVFVASIVTASLLSAFFVGPLLAIENWRLGNSPEQVVMSHCDAVKNRDSQAAYTQLGSRLTTLLSKQDYASKVLVLEPSTCSVTSMQENGQSALVKVTATILGVPGQGVGVFKLAQENGMWKIGDEEFPSFTIDDFCRAILRQESGAYHYFTHNLQAQVSPDVFNQKWIAPYWTVYDWKITSWSGTQASFSVQVDESFYTLYSHAPMTSNGTLVADSNTQWLIQSLQ